MPLAALEAVEPNRIVTAQDLGPLIAEMVGEEAGQEKECPPALPLEVDIAAGARLGAERLKAIADPTALTCPDCDGVLSEVRGETPLRFRCQIGHATTAEVLESRAQKVDAALRVALRVMEERVTLVTRMAEDARRTGRNAVAELYEARSEEYTRYANVLREAAVATLRDNKPNSDEE
jgi:two-component system chemotaxis response regulator CheB